jgi:hypothetical protein
MTSRSFTEERFLKPVVTTADELRTYMNKMYLCPTQMRFATRANKTPYTTARKVREIRITHAPSTSTTKPLSYERPKQR